MNICSISSCKKKDGRSYYSFPEDRELYHAWLSACLSQTTNAIHPSSSKICSVHFSPDDFEYTKGQIRLKSDAIPSMFNSKHAKQTTTDREDVINSTEESDEASELEIPEVKDFTSSERCFVCRKGLTSKDMLKDHLKTLHNIDLDIKSEEEEVRSDTPDNFVSCEPPKEDEESSSSTLKCSICATGCEVMPRMKVVQDGKPFAVCHLCSAKIKALFTAESRQELEAHERKCDIDPHQAWNAGLSAMKVDFAVKPFKCEISGNEYFNEEFLSDHLSREHNFETGEDYGLGVNLQGSGFQCNLCGKAYANQESLTSHKASKHLNEKDQSDQIQSDGKSKYQCDICNKVFHSCSGLTTHKKVVHEGRRYECESCDKSFTTNYNLIAHVRSSHTANPYIFKCDMCDRALKTAQGLAIHKAKCQG